MTRVLQGTELSNLRDEILQSWKAEMYFTNSVYGGSRSCPALRVRIRVWIFFPNCNEMPWEDFKQ